MESDEHLVRLAIAGSTAAADELVRRHWLPCWRIAYGILASREDADDVAQEAFERAFSGLTGLDHPSRFRHWLNRIASNRALDRLRARRADIEYIEHAVPGDDAAGGDLVDRVHAALIALPMERRAVLVLRYWGGFGYEEIAELLDVPVGTVNSRAGRGLEDLRRTLEVDRVHRS